MEVINTFQRIYLIKKTVFVSNFKITKTGRYSCEEAEACSNPHGFQIAVFRLTIINKFKLYCEAGDKKNLYIFLIILVGGLMYLVVCMFSDKFGRSNIFRLSLVLGVIGMISVIFSLDLFSTLIGFTFLSFASDVNNTMCYIYMSEVVLDNFRNWASFVFVLCFFVGEIFSGLVGMAFNNFQSIAVFFLILSIPIIIFLFQLKKSPYFLKSSNKLDQFAQLMNHIAQTNQVPIAKVKQKIQHFQNDSNEFTNPKIDDFNTKVKSNPTGSQRDKPHLLQKYDQDSSSVLTSTDLKPFFQLEQIEDDSQVGLTEYFSRCSNVMKLIAYVFLLSNFYWTIGLTVYLPEIIGFKSLYSNMFFMGCSDFVGGIFMILFINNTRRRFLNYYNLVSNLITVLILFFLQKFNLTDYYFGKILDIILSCNEFILYLFSSFNLPLSFFYF